MNYYVTLTSQGQVSIPSEIRRHLHLEKNDKLVVSLNQGKDEISLKPAPNILNYFGKLNHKSIKNKNTTEIIKIENEIINEASLNNYKKKVNK
jgi:AbrB family looped-hinge helix DNA binding protein